MKASIDLDTYLQFSAATDYAFELGTPEELVAAESDEDEAWGLLSPTDKILADI